MIFFYSENIYFHTYPAESFLRSW